jgi:hypothetical protein
LLAALLFTLHFRAALIAATGKIIFSNSLICKSDFFVEEIQGMLIQ